MKGFLPDLLLEAFDAGQLKVALADGLPELSLLREFVHMPGVSPGELRLLSTLPGNLPMASSQVAVDRASHHLTRDQRRQWHAYLLERFRAQLDDLPQSDAHQETLLILRERLGKGHLQCRLWEQRYLHTRAGIFTTDEQQLCVVSPGGFSAENRSSGDELRSIVTGKGAEAVAHWFEARWEESRELTGDLHQAVMESWACRLIPPREAYLRALCAYFGEMLDLGDGGVDDNPLLEKLTDFQRAAYHHARGILKRFGGVFVSDVVGLGKSYVGMALLKSLTMLQGAQPLVIAPPRLCGMWEELLEVHQIPAQVLATSRLKELYRFEHRDVVLIDEAHHFRNRRTQRYQALHSYLRPGGYAHRPVILLTATPYNNRPSDVLHQLQLFPDVFAELPHEAESLRTFFRQLSSGKVMLSSLMQHVLVRRTRTFIKHAFPEATLPVLDEKGQTIQRPIVFPTRHDGAEQALRYSIEAAYAGLYGEIMRVLSQLTYARYGLADYLTDEASSSDRYKNLARSGFSLRGLFKALLLKRCESSLAAFKRTLQWLSATHEACLTGIKLRGIIPVNPRHPGDDLEDIDSEELLDHFKGNYPLSDFHAEKLVPDLETDWSLLTQLRDKIVAIPPAQDAKLQRLIRHLKTHSPRAHKTLLFTQFEATASYLSENLACLPLRSELMTGRQGRQLSILSRFSPRSMGLSVPADTELDLLIATDVVSEGVNLQDADTIINYDLHWNPVRLIQRAGRIDRIGSENADIYMFNFLPERALEQRLGLEAVLKRRIEEILRVFGEDSTILPLDLQLDEVSVILDTYTGKALDDVEADRSHDRMAGHLEVIRALRRDEPNVYEKLVRARPGQRCILKPGSGKSLVMCQAGWFKRFYQVTEGGQSSPVDAGEAMDQLSRWARGQGWENHAAVHSGVNEAVNSTQAVFADAAQALREQKKHPRLSSAEHHVRDALVKLRANTTEEHFAELDGMIQWIQRGGFQPHFRTLAQRWKREDVPVQAMRAELRGLMMRHRLNEAALPDPETVVAVAG